MLSVGESDVWLLSVAVAQLKMLSGTVSLDESSDRLSLSEEGMARSKGQT